MSDEPVVNIKQRIIGALVLVSIGVILIPMLLNGGLLNQELTGNIATKNDFKQMITDDNIPEMPKALNKVLPKVPEPMLMPAAKRISAYPERAVKEDIVELENTKKEKPTVKAIAKPKVISISKVTTKPTSTPKYKKVEKPSSKTIESAFTLQIASFGVKNNADALKKKLRKKGFKSYIEVIKMANGKIYRLRVGPYLRFKEIASIKKQIEKQFKLKESVIVKY
ncbi:SPOR domain-containing protein [sulfur-oxidizing endosymbiont of Gigantopelta aegis]|uniref:SPOR domain-containing protein n=1 Tax=sulfur-oxidizing endosymbiont of Gigantopelta aegis TaxID=2794934 RepID=UPI0018DB708F|nr:SPOR domain-containing protein [sulfur-oxidizing endosymbiont of Gigantopelta aegis]